MSSKILVTGSSSLVGSHFVELFGNRYEITGAGRTNMFEGTGLLTKFHRIDLLRGNGLEGLIDQSDAEVVLNFAAMTNVDACETQRDKIGASAYQTNAVLVRRLARICKARRKSLYQLSTDAVFDGKRGPYSELAKPGPLHLPLSWYGQTKYLAEQGIIEINPDYCIVRISNPYRSVFKGRLDFARNILRLYREGRLYPLFTDQFITPSLVDDVSQGLDFLLRHGARGIYHIASRNLTTPFDFGCYLVSAFFSVEDPTKVIQRGSVVLAETAGRAPRPVRGGLRTDKVAQRGFTPRTYQQGILEIHHQISSARHV